MSNRNIHYKEKQLSDNKHNEETTSSSNAQYELQLEKKDEQIKNATRNLYLLSMIFLLFLTYHLFSLQPHPSCPSSPLPPTITSLDELAPKPSLPPSITIQEDNPFPKSQIKRRPSVGNHPITRLFHK